MSGLYNKYIIQKSNGKPLDDGAEYFVLRMDDGGDKEHFLASRKAIITYAEAIKDHLPELYKDLAERYFPLHSDNMEARKQYYADVKLKWCEICMDMTKHENDLCQEHDQKHTHWVI